MRLWDSMDGCGQPGADSATGVGSTRVMWRNTVAFHSKSLLQLAWGKFFFCAHLPLSLTFLLPCLTRPVCLVLLVFPVSSCFILLHSVSFLSIVLCDYMFHLSGGLSVYDFICLFLYSLLIHLKVDFGLPGATTSWYIILVFVSYFLEPVPCKFLLSFREGSSSRFQYPQIIVFWK